MTALAHPVAVASARRRRRHRAVLLVALAGAFLATGAAWLATSGVAGPQISAPAGLSGTGAVAQVDGTGLSGQITESHGNAQLNQGVPVTKVVVASGYENHIRVAIAWTNALAAGSFLNGKDQIAVGLYHPIALASSGSCSSGLTVADSTVAGGAICVAIDSSATGSAGVDTSQGTLMVTQAAMAGFLVPSASAGSPPACTTTPVTWCDPAAPSTTVASDQHVLYLLASVENPANHVPPGSQPSSGSLTFFVQVKHAT